MIFSFNPAVWKPTEKEPPPETGASISAAAAGPQAFRQWRDQQRGATLPDLGLRPTPREELSCLKPDELGSPQTTVDRSIVNQIRR